MPLVGLGVAYGLWVGGDLNRGHHRPYLSGFMLSFVDCSSALSGIELHLECDLTTSKCAIRCVRVCVHVLCVHACLSVYYNLLCTLYMCVCMCVCVCQYVGVWEMCVIVVYRA